MEEKNTYMVKIVNLFSVILEVEATSEEEARIEAHKEYTKNPEDHRKAFYEATLPPNQWSVITKEKYEELKAQVEAEFQDKNGNDQENKIISPA
jgi:hypothetical protein